MSKVQSKKISRDMWMNFGRTLLLLIGITFGMFSVFLIVDSFSVIKRESKQSYQSTEPASFSLWVNALTDEQLEELRTDPSLESVEPRRMVRSMIYDEDGSSIETYLYVVEDFNDIKINKFFSKTGKNSPGKGEILIENLSADVINCNVGDVINLKLPLSYTQQVKVTGIVNAPGFKPAWIEKCVYCFVDNETFENLGESRDFTQVLFTVSDDKEDKEHITETAYEIKEKLSKEGVVVNRVEIKEPGEHPNGKQIDALMFLFELFAVLSLILSGVLVVNLISVLMNEQKKQIGIMKSLGALNTSIAKLYYRLILRISLISLAIAIPASYLLAKQITLFCADMLNIEISTYSISHYILVIEILLGIIVPFISAHIAINKYCRLSVKECITENEIKNLGGSKGKYIFGRINNLILKMSFTNSFRNMKKLMVLAATISVGGAVFIISINLRESLNKTVENAESRINYNLLVVASDNYNPEEVDEALKDISGVTDVAYVSGGMAFYSRDESIQSNSFLMAGLPQGKVLYDYPLISGNGLSYQGENEILINQVFQNAHPEVEVGDTLTITSNGKSCDWEVIGVVKEIGGDETVYVDQELYNKAYLDDSNAFVREIALFTDDSTDLEDITSELEKSLVDAKIDYQNIQSITDINTSFANHLKLIAGFLMIVSVLIIAVGMVALISFITVNISERAKELGVMMSIGGRHRDITRIFMYENGVVVILSLIASAIIACPLTIHTSDSFGRIFMEAPLDWVYSMKSIGIWFALISASSMLISFITVKSFLRKKVSEIINYE